MPSTAERVQRHLEADPMLQDGLARGVLSFRRTARWLLSQPGWDATEEAVVSALRRHTIADGATTLSIGREMLAQAKMKVRSGLALVTLPREPETYDGLRRLWGKTGWEKIVGALPGDTSLRFILEEGSLDTAVRTLGPACVRSMSRPVSGIHLLFPEAEQGTSPALTIVLHALWQHSVEVLDVYSCEPECSLLVPSPQEVRAHEVVWALTTIGRSN